MIQLGIFAKTFVRKSVNEVFQAVVENGFELLHLNLSSAGLDPMPDHIPPDKIEEIQKATHRFNLRISGLSATYNMAHPSHQVREEGLAKLRVLAKNCQEIGTDFLTLCTGTRHPSNKWQAHPDNNSREAWRDMSKSMEKALSIAEKEDIFLGVEPELGNIVNSIDKASRLITEMQSNRLRIIMDPANLFEKAAKRQIADLISRGLDLLGPHIHIAHAKDRDEQGHFVAPGKGMIPFDFFISGLDSAGFKGALVAHGFPESQSSFVAQHLGRIIPG